MNIQDTGSITLLQFFFLGGWAMWPLLFFSIVVVTITLERIITIFLLNNLSIKEFSENIMKYVYDNDIEQAKRYCKDTEKKFFVSSIIYAILEVASLGEHRMEKACEVEGQEKIIFLERGFNILIALGSLSPITGFLGTVSGMINAFDAIRKASEVNAQIVAGGIFEALITTEYGLIIAIVAIAAYNIFVHFVDKFAADVESLSSKIIKEIVLKTERKE